MQPKKEWVVSGHCTNTFTGSRVATILEWGKTLMYIENVGNLSGGGSGAVYSVQAIADQLSSSPVNWFTIYSGNVLYSGGQHVLKIDGDPWDAVRFNTMNYKSGYNASMVGYVNRSPR